MSRQRLFIVDDNDAFRESAAMWLSRAGYDVQALDGPDSALETLRNWQASRAVMPDDEELACLMLDVQMPKMSGLKLYEALAAEGIALPVIYMTGNSDVPTIVEAMKKHRAVSFLEKPSAPQAVKQALHEAFEQARQMKRAREADQTGRETPGEREYAARVESLSAREREVLELLRSEMSNKEMARELDLSMKTIELYRSKLMIKMQARNATHLIRMISTKSVD